MDFDVIVVGAGLTGLVTARELCTLRQDIKVGVIDAGPRSAAQTLPEMREHAGRQPYVVRWATVNSMFGGHGLKEIVGGRSLCWDGVAPRLQESALATWPSGPDVAQLEPYLERAEELLHVRAVAGQLAQLELIRRMTGRQLAPLKRALFDDGTPYSPIIYLRERRFSLLSETRAHVVVRSGRGVTLRCTTAQGEELLTARVVILGCGTVMNGILLGGSALLELGQTELTTPIADHLVVGAWTTLRPGELDGLDGLDAGTTTDEVFYEIVQAYRLGEKRVLDWWAMGDCPPSPDSRVVVRLQDGVPAAEVDFRYSTDDLVTVQRMVDRIAGSVADLPSNGRALTSAPLHLLDLPAFGGAPSPDGWSWYLNPPGSVHHEYGTTALGGSLVDSFGGSRHVPGLYAVGASTFARMGAFNPSLTAIALAMRTARHIVDSLV